MLEFILEIKNTFGTNVDTVVLGSLLFIKFGKPIYTDLIKKCTSRVYTNIPRKMLKIIFVLIKNVFCKKVFNLFKLEILMPIAVNKCVKFGYLFFVITVKIHNLILVFIFIFSQKMALTNEQKMHLMHLVRDNFSVLVGKSVPKYTKEVV